MPMNDIWQTIELSLGDLKLVVLPGIGGRLWDVVYSGRSLLFQNPDLAEQIPKLKRLTDLPTKSPQFKFPLWGGEKTWIAPDSAWVNGAPFPVLDSAPYRITARDGRQVTMQSEVCPLTGLEIERRITLNSSTNWNLQHEVRNCGTAERLTGIWSVLMLNHPTRIGLEIGQNADIRSVFGNADGFSKKRAPFAIFNCNEAKEFKVGMNNSAGRVFMALAHTENPAWIVCTTPAPAKGDRFAHGHEFEVFNSGDYFYCEAEWHAPAKDLKPGESTGFMQNFKIWSGSDGRPGEDFTPAEQELLRCMS
ncbi:hypothetical protein [Hoeflea sp. TYP-13]|uniref:hypothetical protein n=1 Tax=Hoeflea sp. TYP-13 TaxID=3230023 RepID=UPI0034C66F36